MNVMTPAQVHAARMMIPGGFELNASPHRPAPSTPPATPTTLPENGRAVVRDVAHVAASSLRPTTGLRFAAGIAGDISILMALIYGAALVPGFVVHWMMAAAALVVPGFGAP